MYPEPQPEVFTRAFKLRGSIISGGLTLALFVVPFFGGLGLAVLIGKRFGDAPGAVAVFAAIGLALVGQILANQYLLLYGNAGLRRDLAAALQRRTGHNPDDGRAYFVGWAPGRSLNPKDMETDHDVGFLSLTPERMVFLGDTVHFELHRSQVVSVSAGIQGIPILFDFGYRITVEWLDDYGGSNAFSLERREGRSRRQVRRGTRELRDALQCWHQTGAAPSGAASVQPPM
ncbi:MAG: hypothetical protein FJX74_11945 [Armatimonadetes bacterium]|nr:hypothetical protein [Armatimonadota bacterium]